MTTVDLILGWQSFGAWLFGLEEKAAEFISPRAIADWIVDRFRWFRNEVARRRHYPAARHRDTDSGMSVWEYLHRLPLEELKYEWEPRGQHRDNRGWRYRSSVWPLLERLHEYRVWSARISNQIDQMMDDIQYMLDHPPAAASVTIHGCQDCLCGQIAEIRREALV